MSDVEALAMLTGHQRKVMELVHRGHDDTEIAERLRISRQNVITTRNKAVARITGGRAAKERAAAKVAATPAWQRLVDTSKARIQQDIAAGKRCKRCWLLSPCDDHER